MSVEDVPPMFGLRTGERVLIVGGYGVRNVGDESILSGLLTQLPDRTVVTVVSRSPVETARMHGTTAVSARGALLALLRSDVLIVGGGGLFSGHMGPLGRVIPLFALTALMLRKRVMFHGVGVYPSTPRWVLFLIVRLAPRLRLFTVRDSISAAFLRSRGVSVRQVPDLALSMPESSRADGEAIIGPLGLDPTRPIVGLCLTGTEPRLGEGVIRAVSHLVSAMPDVQFCFIPMSHHPGVATHNDLAFAYRVREQAPRVVVMEDWRGPSHVLSVFRHLSAVLCMRYHSLLFAERAGVPVIAIAYAEKVASWAEEHPDSVMVEPDGPILERHVRAALQVIPLMGT